jgi:hypothetical protein
MNPRPIYGKRRVTQGGKAFIQGRHQQAAKRHRPGRGLRLRQGGGDVAIVPHGGTDADEPRTWSPREKVLSIRADLRASRRQNGGGQAVQSRHAGYLVTNCAFHICKQHRRHHRRATGKHFRSTSTPTFLPTRLPCPI